LPASDLSLLIDAARAAGAEALSHLGTDLGVTYKDHDKSPVTCADHAVDRVLAAQLRAARPHYGWLSEESRDDAGRARADTVFIIDPIDGTRAFIDGQSAWSHSIAVAERGRVTAAVVYLPMKDAMYTAALGSGARLNGKPIRATEAGLEGAEVLATKPNMEPHHWIGGPPPVNRSHRPSLAYRLSLVAEGRFDAMLTLRPAWEWDIAAGSLIAEEAGARATDRRGAPLRFNAAHPQTDGVLVAGPALHADLLDRLV
jgi:myo-inositol-1(or 4)-monophosphatase